jgi:hypothetical protein
MVLHAEVWPGTYLLIFPIIGLFVVRLNRKKANIHRNEQTDAVVALARTDLQWMPLIWEITSLLVLPILYFVLQSPTIAFPHRETDAVIFIDEQFLHDPEYRATISRGISGLYKKVPGIRVGIMTSEPAWLSFRWLQSEQDEQQSLDVPGTPIPDSAGGTIIDASLRVMSPWRRRRFLLALIGPQISPQQLGSETALAQNLHLSGLTVKVGEDAKHFGYLSLGHAIIMSDWYDVSVLGAFNDFGTTVAENKFGFWVPLVAFCLILVFATAAAWQSEEELLFGFAKRLIMRRIFSSLFEIQKLR